jgi:hypothetical protein
VGKLLVRLKFSHLKALSEIIETTKQSDIRVKGIGLLHQVKSFNFIFGLKMMHLIIQLIVKVSELLQSPDINLINVMSNIKCLRESFIHLRNVKEFQNIFNDAKDVCVKQKIDISIV